MGSDSFCFSMLWYTLASSTSCKSTTCGRSWSTMARVWSLINPVSLSQTHKHTRNGFEVTCKRFLSNVPRGNNSNRAPHTPSKRTKQDIFGIHIPCEQTLWHSGTSYLCAQLKIGWGLGDYFTKDLHSWQKVRRVVCLTANAKSTRECFVSLWSSDMCMVWIPTWSGITLLVLLQMQVPPLGASLVQDSSLTF